MIPELESKRRVSNIFAKFLWELKPIMNQSCLSTASKSFKFRDAQQEENLTHRQPFFYHVSASSELLLYFPPGETSENLKN